MAEKRDYDTDGLYKLFGQIVKLHFTRAHNTLDKLGLYPGQPPLLFSLHCNGGQSQKELADNLGIKPATITVMVKRMEKSELITREQDEEDQRISRVYLTEKGKQVCEELKGVMSILNAECFSNFTDEEKILLRRLLLQVKDNLMKANDN